jgi:protein phosphatase
MHSAVGWWTDSGPRRTNQDATLRARIGEDGEVVAVADGMGGHAAGEVASRQALDALLAALQGGAGLDEAVDEVNRLVYRMATASPELQGMGTTLVAYLRRGGQYEIASVGDSRAYRIEGRTIACITRDHSFMAEAVASGELTAEEAQRSRWRNALTRAIGTDPEVEADRFGPFDLNPAETILLCTDGFHRWVEEEEISRWVDSAEDLQTAAAALGEVALRAGSDDNITLMLIATRSTNSAASATGQSVAAAPRQFSEFASPGHLSELIDESARPLHQRRRSKLARGGWRWWQRWDVVGFMVIILVLLISIAVLGALVG